MDRQIGILHLSDIHACKKTEDKLARLIELLKKDLKELMFANNTGINLVCISGDLINSGDNSNEELDIVINKLISPLMGEFNLSEKSFYIVPGNHEIKRSAIIPYIESGLSTTLNTEENIEEFLNSFDSQSLQRINYFNDFSSLFGEKTVLNNDLMKSHIVDIEDLKIGIVCINSAWRSTGIGEIEKGKMVVGRKLIIDGFESIKSTDIKICIMHHPLDWLVDSDKAAIEKCINEFDIILNGHIHETSTKMYTSYNGQAIYNTCGKFDNTSDIYNGYSLICINPYNKECNIHLRQYFDYPRNCFDRAIGLQTNGIFTASISKKDDNLALAYDIVHSISEKFLEYANGYFVSNVVSGKNIKKFDDAFILPTFSKYSEYEKETAFDDDEDEKSLTLEEICNNPVNILLLGKKEIGKTTILHYIIKNYITNFNTLHAVPILIDCALVNYAGKNVISREAYNYINKFCSDEESFSQKQIEALFEAGLCTVLFDNLEVVEKRELDKINEFISKYSKNKFIFSEKETIGARAFRDIPVIPDCKFEEIHVCTLTKSQIRSATKQYMFAGDDREGSSLVDKVMLCFKKTTLPKTPFVLSLILSLCDNSDFSPINEAVVMEQFMEFLFEKNAPGEADSRAYDFRIKEDFLINIVSYMHAQNQYFLSREEFNAIVNDYHSYTGFSVDETRFDNLFFDRGVLVEIGEIITFRYSCMIEYYIAKKAGQNPEFLKELINNKNYLHYSSELLYYTGLNRKNSEILTLIQNDLLSYYAIFNPMLDKLKNYEIGIDVTIPEDMLKHELPEKRFSQETSDKLSDVSDMSENVLPEKIDKQRNFDQMNAFIQTLLIYGNCLKNLELISRKEKEDAYDIYLIGLCIMLSILQSRTEDFFDKIINDMEKDPENNTEETVVRMETVLKDLLKIALPISIQNIALENVGTSKLRIIFENAIKNSTQDDFKKFFSVFMYADLRLPGLRNILKKYAKEAENKSLLKIILVKLLYYYQFRYFSPVLDPFLEDTLADINIKLQNSNKFAKSQVIKEIKEKERQSQ